MNDYLQKLVATTIHHIYGIAADFVIEHPKDISHGDYATNAALSLSKLVGKKPFEIAEVLVAELTKIKEDFVVAVTIAGPGFINFTLSRDYFVSAISEASGTATYGYTNVYVGKKILVEHSSPNLFKPFHIGHLMNNTIGESITRLAQMSSAEVTTMSFPSDISLGVAKAIFILLEEYQDSSTPYTISQLGEAYVKGVKRYDEDESIHSRVKEIADNLYAKKTSSLEYGMFEISKAFNIAYFENIVTQLGSTFDYYIYESEAGVKGSEIVRAHTPTVFTESEGAVVYIPESPKLHTAVFINSQGNPTYEAKDIGLLSMKFERYSPDLSLFVTDIQQVSHFQVVLDAATHIKSEWAEKSLHRYHGRMSFKGQKMSSRLGGVPTVEDVLASVVSEVREKNADVADVAAAQIGIGAIKFAILRASAGKDIDFDPDTSLSFEGDSGPYLQYTAVRAQSLLSKGAEAGIAYSAAHPVSGTELLEKMVARFPEVMTAAQRQWLPHHVVGYLLELAQAFNSWYGQGKIIDEDTAATAYRLAVVKAVRQTIENGLYALGIEVPEKM